MDTTFPLKLQIVSLQLSDISADDFLCSISLMKGMQNFGQVKFQIDKQLTEYTFNDLNIIKFFYAPRLTTRRDVFFKIILTDLQSNQQMGEIPISTHLLAETFQQDKNAIIQCRNQFFEGVTLFYKIYQPQFQLKSNQITYGFQSAKKNDFISNLFARPQVPKINLSSTPIQSKVTQTNPQFQKTQSFTEITQVPPKKKPQPLDSLGFLGNLLGKKTQQPQQKIQQTRLRKNSMKISHAKVKQSGVGEDLIAKLLGHIRQSRLKQQQKKYTLSASGHHGHHANHGISKKLKMVIILLIFGLFMVFADMFQDAFSPPSQIKKSKKNLKKKIKVSHH